MTTKVSYFLTINPERDENNIGINVINRIGEYIASEIAIVSVAPYTNNSSYSGKIKQDLIDYSNTLSEQEITTTSDDGKYEFTYTRDDKTAIISSLNDATSGLSKLVTTIETIFTTTQTAANAQFLVPTPPPYVYVSKTFYNAIIAVFVLPSAIDLANAFDLFVVSKYASLGV